MGYFDTANEQTRMKGVRIVDAGGVDVSLGAELHSGAELGLRYRKPRKHDAEALGSIEVRTTTTTNADSLRE